ncbi:MAG: isocitrate/isopropylmalate dehydrogenase family protein [Candidatus Omnitrophica bacterium]|nr:isocitrate/isopropylmalate dehydrogenase family protein [Candidatus Omnitrophota bacterium]
MAHKVTFIPGDGIGPDVADAAKRCVDATGVKIDWIYKEAGSDVIAKYKTPLPEDTLLSIKNTKVALKGPITTPVGTGFRSVNVELRKRLDLFVCLRPCKSYKGVRSKYENIDLVILRENTEDLYAGIEFEKGRDDTKNLIKQIEALSNKTIKQDSGISIKPISVSATERLVNYAFDYAIKNKCRKITVVHKANIMKFTDGLFLETARKTAQNFKTSGIEFEDRIVDNMCMQLVQVPEKYDVIVLPNLYGDILSDLCAGLVGGLGVAPGANIGTDCAVFEATHGSAPKYKGLNKVNPVAMILSGVLMLKHLGENKAAEKLEKAVSDIIAEGKYVTYDLTASRTEKGAVGTKEMADAIIKRVK